MTFAYENAAAPSLRDVSLVVEAGSTVALVGGTGSGKSTLVRLIARLYDPTSGSVLVDGADVRTLDLGELRRAIAVVDDDPFLFSATVHDNIAYGRPEATREEVVLAAERAQAAGFIAELPEGYDTRVGERGLTLSGGQRQRLAIARALLADPRILVLDDATSSVDATTEQAIKEALREVMAGRTTFVIAHRLSTIALADEIVVLEDGEVIAHGTHDELLTRSDAVRGDRRTRACRTRCSSTGTRSSVSQVSEQPHRHLAELRRRLRQTGGRGRKLRGLLELLRPYRGRTLLMLGSLLIATAAALAPPPLAKLAIDNGIVPGDLQALTWIVVAFLASALIYWGATYAQTYLTGWVGQRALQDLRIQLFAHLQTLSVGFYSRRQAGVLISRLTNDVQALDQLVSDGVVTLFGSTLTLIGTAAILIVLDLELALLTFLVFPVLAIGSLAFRIVSRRRLPRSRARRSRRSPPTCRSRCRASASCARSPRSSATSTASPSSTTRTARRT